MRNPLAWLAFAAACAAAQAAAAGCREAPLGETEASFVSAAAVRMRPLGISDINGFGRVGKRDYFRLEGGKPKLFFVADGTTITEVGVTLGMPAKNEDSERQIALSAFMLARISQEPEKAVDAKLRNSLSTNPPGQWVVSVGNATANLTKTKDLVVILAGKLDCR